MVQKLLLASLPLIGLGAAVSAQSGSFDQRSEVILDMHNTERDRLGLQPLQWDDALASEAAQWASHLAREGRMVHATQDQRRNAGENLWMGTKGYFGPDVMVGGFIDERRYFRPRRFSDVSTTGDWRDTHKIGCAIAEGPREEFLVCRYWPAGNYWGREVY